MAEQRSEILQGELNNMELRDENRRQEIVGLRQENQELCRDRDAIRTELQDKREECEY